MAIIKGGIFGFLNGRIGNRVYYELGGKQVSRLVGRNVKPYSLKQLTSQMELKVLNDFLASVIEFIRWGFGPEALRMNIYPHNVAVRCNKRLAQKGAYPEIEMDHERVLLSKGTLPGLADVAVRLMGDAIEGLALVFEWAVLEEDREWPRCEDQVMLLAYLPEETQEPPACCTLFGAKREAGQDLLRLPAYAAGQKMEVYVSVISQDRAAVSDSQHLIIFI